MRTYVLLVIASLATALGLGAGTATAAPISYGGACVLHPDNRAATIDSLRFHCSIPQQDAIYHDAPRGAVPMGVKNGWVNRPPAMVGVASALWRGKTFHTGPNGGFLLNRTVIGDIWRADVYTAPSWRDGGPAWALNYAPSPTPQLYDEIREVTPGVWFGYSFWNGNIQLTFILA